MSKIKLMDCTLRDGGNVVGKGFPADITDMVLDGLTACHVPFIEFGNSGGIGAYEVAGFTDALTDTEYLQIAVPGKKCGPGGRKWDGVSPCRRGRRRWSHRHDRHQRY